MARISKANAVKSKAKAKSLKEESSKSAVAEKRAQIRVVTSQKNSSTKAKEASKAEAVATAAPTEKKVSQRLIETIEKRRQAKGGAVPGRVPGRRGRRPKALAEYVPSTNEEENTSNESEYEGLEYDTGIRVKEGKDDYGFSMDRFEDYDEELNFDW